jgi:hypothetical protein
MDWAEAPGAALKRCSHFRDGLGDLPNYNIVAAYLSAKQAAVLVERNQPDARTVFSPKKRSFPAESPNPAARTASALTMAREKTRRKE